jgi:hypothetical protein
MKQRIPHLAILTVLLVCFLAVVPPAVHGAAENLQGAMNFIWAQPNTGNNSPGVGWQALDLANASRQPTVRVCIDDLVKGCPSNNFIDVPSNCPTTVATGGASCLPGQNHGSWRPASDGNLGSVNPIDGLQHQVKFWIRSQDNPGTGDIAMDNWPSLFTYTWDNINHTFLAYDIPVTTSATPIAASKMRVLVNRSDPYSIGSVGADYCVQGSDHIKVDGVAGYLGQLNSIPCDADHFIVSSMTVSDTISVADFNTAWQTKFNAATGTEFASAAWMQPNIVTGGTNAGPGSFANCEPSGTTQPCYSMAGWITMYPTTNGVEPTGTPCIQHTYKLGKGPDNPWYNSGTNATPFTTNAVMPTILLAAATCTAGCSATNGTGTWTANFAKWKIIADAGFAAIGSNPTGGNAQVSICTPTPNCAVYSENLAMTPASLGHAISSAWNYIRVGTAASPSGSEVTLGTGPNAIYYGGSSASWKFDSGSLSAISGSGLGMGLGSVTGFLSGGRSQVSDLGWLATTTGGMTGTPMVMSGGTAVEPCEAVALKHIRSQLYGAYITAGNSGLAAYWKSAPDPWNLQLSGYPFMQPFSPPLPTAKPTWFMVRAVFPMIGIACFAFLGFVRRIS